MLWSFMLHNGIFEMIILVSATFILLAMECCIQELFLDVIHGICGHWNSEIWLHTPFHTLAILHKCTWSSISLVCGWPYSLQIPGFFETTAKFFQLKCMYKISKPKRMLLYGRFEAMWSDITGFEHYTSQFDNLYQSRLLLRIKCAEFLQFHLIFNL